jgi:hypothetical protein
MGARDDRFRERRIRAQAARQLGMTDHHDRLAKMLLQGRQGLTQARQQPGAKIRQPDPVARPAQVIGVDLV